MKQILIVAGVIIGAFLLWRVGNFIYMIYKIKTQFSVENLSKGETGRTIENGRNHLPEYAQLTHQEAERYFRVLEENHRWFEQNGVGTREEFQNRIEATVDTLRELMANERVMSNLKFFFRVANIEYGRKHKLNFAEKVVEDWAVRNLTREDRIRMVESTLAAYTKYDNDDSESKSEDRQIYQQTIDKLLVDLAHVRNTPQMNAEQYRGLVEKSIADFEKQGLKTDGGENITLVCLVAKTYYDISQQIGADVKDMLLTWYDEQTATEPPSFDEIEQRVRGYGLFMEDGGHTSSRNCRKIEQIVLGDMKLFRSSSDSAMLTKTAIASLRNIELMAGDTEDREFYAFVYCDLAHNKGFSIGKQVEEWMYGKYDKEAEEMRANRLPWE